MRKWVRSLHGERIVFTGGLWLRRADMRKQIRRHGASADGSVSFVTTLLVKGELERWKYGDHGLKESQAARLIREGASISLLHESEFRQLLEEGTPAHVADRVAGEPVEWLSPKTERQFKQAAKISGSLDREQSALGRVEQGFLRQMLFGNAGQADCSLCGRRLPVELLVAAHVKLRSECTRRERLEAIWLC
jgi:BRCT domain type II-containing protein